MEFLLLVVERRGKLVTRNKVVERVSGNDVFLDTGGFINAAQRRLLRVLEDDFEQPRFVQQSQAWDIGALRGSSRSTGSRTCRDRNADFDR
jgi:hypothetical protein